MAKSDKNAKNRWRNVFTADLRLAKFGGYFFRRIFGGQIFVGEFGDRRRLRGFNRV